MAAIDPYVRISRKPPGGPSNLFEITPNDAVDLTSIAHWLHLSSGGSLRVTTANGQTVTFANLLPGWHALEIARVHATGTTATGLIGGW